MYMALTANKSNKKLWEQFMTHDLNYSIYSTYNRNYKFTIITLIIIVPV